MSILVLVEEQSISWEERERTFMALKAVVLLDVKLVGNLVGRGESSLVLGADQMLAMFDMYVVLTFLSVLENIKALTAVQEAVTLDKSRTIMIDQEVVGTVERVDKLELAGKSTFVQVRLFHVVDHPFPREHLCSEYIKFNRGCVCGEYSRENVVTRPERNVYLFAEGALLDLLTLACKVCPFHAGPYFNCSFFNSACLLP